MDSSDPGEAGGADAARPAWPRFYLPIVFWLGCILLALRSGHPGEHDDPRRCAGDGVGVFLAWSLTARKWHRARTRTELARQAASRWVAAGAAPPSAGVAGSAAGGRSARRPRAAGSRGGRRPGPGGRRAARHRSTELCGTSANSAASRSATSRSSASERRTPTTHHPRGHVAARGEPRHHPTGWCRHWGPTLGPRRDWSPAPAGRADGAGQSAAAAGGAARCRAAAAASAAPRPRSPTASWAAATWARRDA